MSDMNLAGFRHRADFRAWQQAKRVHQLEHASGVQPTTFACDVVGHLTSGDDYQSCFDDDMRRKFCMAANRSW